MSKSDVLAGRKGVVSSYRRGKHLQHPNQVILLFNDISSRDGAAALVGRKVKWTSETGREFLGKVLGPHGNSGAVRAKFRTNLPGQAIGTPVVLV
ncbi:MAG: 50S ribosomal protein L35ae [Candidatus Thorarchaeota archaeon]|nr:MAG: 50S ribosomal protein L35ae [Candidatus Thorarchaeota archaeon]RLI58715.1 MAG: 50S ribosomal protein L35ae [Candidatus Thorarchaeota archaeon]